MVTTMLMTAGGQMNGRQMSTTHHDYTPLETMNNDGGPQQVATTRRLQNTSKFSTKFIIFIIIIATVLAAAMLHLIVIKIVASNSSKHMFSSSSSIIYDDAAAFKAALARQQRGVIDVRLNNGLLDVNGTWTTIPRHFNQIWKDQLSKFEVLKLLSGGEEIKYFLPFCPNVKEQQRQCTLVTFGVGHTVTAEQKLTQLYPECHLIAADPAEEVNANLTRAIGGTFVHTPIGGETAIGQPINSWGGNESTILVQRKMLTQIGIVDFMNNYTHWQQQPVDLLLIDIEGAEFGIIEQLAYHYERFTGSICQINIEVHDPNTLIADYTHEQFFRSLDTLLRSGHFALMNTDMYTGAAPLHLFLRMFFVNVVDAKCTKKFIDCVQ